MTHWLVGYLSAPATGAAKRLSRTRVQLLLYLQNMTHAATYNRVCPLPDVRYDVTSRATVTGNVLPVVAFPSRNQHIVVFTGPYPEPEGPWIPVYRFFR